MGDIVAFLLWYLCISLLGWIAFPLVFRLLPALKDRGFTLSRPLGWLLWGYAFWIMASLGIAQNDLGGVLLAFAILATLSLLTLRNGGFGTLVSWLREQRRLVITSEVLFLASFAIWAFVRAANPEIVGTEKPMEMAFINSILHSATFPPNDPWLSGYSISYYYFGYVLVAMLIRVTGVVSGVGFNLAIALIFGLVALGAYGLLYNLLQLVKKPEGETVSRGWLSLPILGPLFILIVSNFEGFLEVLHAKGFFWNQNTGGPWTSAFWKWLDIQELVNPPAQPLSWMPARVGGIVWWRASRVLTDYSVAGEPKEIIDEFPFFSYLLSDLHPHVLTMPFGLLALSLALHVFLDRRDQHIRILGFDFPIGLPSFALAAVALGGLGFLNTWDFPIYVILFSAAFALARYFRQGWSLFGRLREFLGMAFALGISGYLLYLPFYLGFSSQAGGPLPSMAFTTRGAHLWVMFGPLLIPIAVFLIYLWRQPESAHSLSTGLKLALGLYIGLTLLMFAYAALISVISYQGAGQLFLNNLGALEQGLPFLNSATLMRRFFIEPGAWITLVALLAILLGLLGARNLVRPVQEEGGDGNAPAFLAREAGYGFIVLVILIGVLLILEPEFFYLRDGFGSRMNTIFKFYFQAWILLGVAAAFATAVLLLRLKPAAYAAFSVLLGVVLVMALAYPTTMLWIKTNGFNSSGGLTLDGNAGIVKYNPEEQKAIDWLRQEPVGTVAEAVGGEYSDFARIATNSGQPDVIGWVGHEFQWGRGSKEIGNREQDVAQLYQTNNWDNARLIIQQYQIRYIYIGDLEASKYRVSRTKFDQNLVPAFKSDQVTIYQVPDSVLNASAVAQK